MFELSKLPVVYDLITSDFTLTAEEPVCRVDFSPKKHKMDSPASKKSRLIENSLRFDLTDEETISSIKSAWKSSDFMKNDVEVIHHPFPVCIIRNFVNNPELLKLVAGEVEGVTFNQKSNDLYEFKQSDDVKTLIDFTAIPQLYDLIRFDGRKLVSSITGGIKLNEDISATFSLYGYEDRLLCHDDKCEDRHIAFILYLVEDWCEGDGGSLDLFSTDLNNYPHEIVKSISPEFNMMVFFEVSEVKSKTKKRLSINGWFHSLGKKLDKPNCKILENQRNLANDKDFNLEEHFLFIYFDNMNKMDIKNIFASESQIQLDEFIVPMFLDKIKTELRSDSVVWVSKGPANIRKYEAADLSALPTSIQTLKEIFESKCWFRYLKSITGLDFSPSVTSDLKIWERGNLPFCSFEVQRWTHSCYTLIHDQDPEFHSEALDVILRIPFEDSEQDDEEEKEVPEGGHIIYIDSTSKDEDCLLHIGYKMNSLGLIFRDKKTLRFTKYIGSTARPFYQILCTYRPWKPPQDEPELKHCEEDDNSENSISEDESHDECS